MNNFEPQTHVIVDSITAENLKFIAEACSHMPKLQELLNLKLETESPLGDWITEVKAMALLHKGKTSLWKLRKAGLIIASNTKPLFYSLESLKSYIKGKAK